jgi:hypothetical protein
MMHPVTMQELHRARQRDLLKEAEALRMIRQAKAAQPARPCLVKRIVDSVGTLLIDAGRRLTERYTSLEDRSTSKGNASDSTATSRPLFIRAD